MTNIKPFTLGSRFFPENKERLQNDINTMFKTVPQDYNTSSRVLLVPHAAYKYSGLIAANAYQYLDKNIKNVFIFSPAHYLLFYGTAMSSFEAWETPLGEIHVNQEICRDIAEISDADYIDRAFEKEHAIDVQLPFIQTILPEAKIVPLLFGSSNFNRIEKIVAKYYPDKSCGFISAADLTHFYSQEQAIKLDEYDSEQIEERGAYDIFSSHSSFSNGLVATSEFARNNGYSLIRVKLGTSGEIAGSDSKVEGYGSWFMVEMPTPKFVKEQFSDVVLTICRNSIISGIEFGSPTVTEGLNLAAVFDSRGSSFVTVKVDGEVKGVSGTIFAYQPLREDLAQNAFKAAFKEDGQKAVSGDELDKIELEICLLTRPAPIPFTNIDELADKIEQGKDGLFVRDEEHEAFFLPSKWKEYSDKKSFVDAVFEKAGINPKSPRQFLEAYKFRISQVNS